MELVLPLAVSDVVPFAMVSALQRARERALAPALQIAVGYVVDAMVIVRVPV